MDLPVMSEVQFDVTYEESGGYAESANSTHASPPADHNFSTISARLYRIAGLLSRPLRDAAHWCV